MIGLAVLLAIVAANLVYCGIKIRGDFAASRLDFVMLGLIAAILPAALIGLAAEIVFGSDAGFEAFSMMFRP